jgi:WD40 repeat protein
VGSHFRLALLTWPIHNDSSIVPLPEPSRVFISYSRSDGADYAAALRKRLQKEHPEIDLFQDVISLHSGKDWWLQITNALNQVAYMVLVATPDAMASEAVRKEWRYARQQGVCVLPVQASEALDFSSLPRWMRTQQFANLKVKEQWELFIGDLHRACQTPRVLFMAEDLPKDFVARPAEFEPLIKMLLDERREQRNPVAITTALRGAGGFGKTTLAKAVCHDERIQEVFKDGVLWVTLGEKVDNLVGKVAELTTMLSGEPTNFTSKEAAVTRLRELLADRDILMVIDDVWEPAHLDPFLQGGPHCARLITTRNLDVLPQECRDATVKVDSMQPDEAVAVLGSGLPDECGRETVALAERVGNWPLLLAVVNGHLRERIEAHQPLSEAIADVNEVLDEGGLTALDPDSGEARNRAVALTVEISLRHLRDEGERQRFAELSIFPEDVEIPLDVVGRLWSATGGFKSFKARDLCVRLNRRSLLQTLDLTTRKLRLHDVMRSYLQDKLAQDADPKQVHGKLVDAWGDPNKLPDIYAWRWYAYHMAAAGRVGELREALLDPAWLQAKLAATDVTALTTDFDLLLGDEDLELVEGAIRLSANVIGRDRGQFASQMVGRLLTFQDAPVIAEFSKQLVEGTRARWLRPLQPTLRPPASGLVRTLEGHRGATNAVAVTSEGKLCVSASHDETLKVWDLRSGRELRTLAGHGSRVLAVAVTPDGKLAVSGCEDGTLKEWDLGSGHQLRTLIGHHESYVTAVAVTPDGQRAVSASWDHTLKIWNLASGYARCTLTGHAAEVLAVAVTPDGRRAVSASGDQTLKVWDLSNGRELRTLTGHASYVTAVAVTPDGQRAVSASYDRTLKVWELDSGRELRTLIGHTGWVTAAALTPDGRRAVSASADRTLKIWELDSDREPYTLAGHTHGVPAVAVTPDGQRAVSTSDDGTLKVWDLAGGRELRTLAGHSGSLHAVAVTPEGQRAVSASHDKTLNVWDLAGGRKLRTLAGHSGSVNAVVVTPDGQRAVSASHDQTLKVWDLSSGRELRTLTGRSGPVTAVAVTPDGQRAVSTSYDRTLKLWDLASGRELRTLSGHPYDVTAVAVTPDGQRVLSASWDHTLKVWDLASGHELRTLNGHSSGVAAVAVTPDGQRAVSASYDNTVKVWDLETGAVLATFTCDGAAHCCAFSDALKLIVAGDAGGHVHFLRLEEPKSRG